MTDTGLRAARALSLHNRGALSLGGQCGCFHCLSVFAASEVEEWVEGGTALCPRCGIDAALSAHTSPIDPDFLRQMRARYFERTVRWDPSGPWTPIDAL